MLEYKSIKDDVLKKLEENFFEIQNRFGIETIGIFGSVSRGEDTLESDVDILYRYVDDNVTLENMLGLKAYLEDLFGREVDLVGIRWIDPMMKPYVETDMILFEAGVATA